MARSTKEWIGKTDDQRAPKRVRDRLRDDHPNCYLCHNHFVDGDRVALDHVKALINGGENRESNLRPVHIKCHAEKTRADVAEKVRVAAKRQASRGIADHVKKLEGRQFDQSPRQARNQAKAGERPALPPRHLYGSLWQRGELSRPSETDGESE